MREILFRGKRIDNGEWIEGFYFQKQNLCDADGDPIKHCISDIPPFGEEVIPETVGQYTGLKDWNDQCIFEGDIVRMKGSGITGFGVVEFRNGSFGIADKKRKRFYFLDDHSVYRIDGNIHDNPDFLRASNDDQPIL